MTDTASAAPTYQQVVAAWNAQADEYNQWDALGEDEKIEWAVACAKAVPAPYHTLTPSEELYWRLHGLSKILEGSGLIDESQHPDAYSTILDAMAFVRRNPAENLYDAQAQTGAALLDEARRLFDSGWKAAARFCDREDVVADGIIGFGACPRFEAAFAASHGIKGGQHSWPPRKNPPRPPRADTRL